MQSPRRVLLPQTNVIASYKSGALAVGAVTRKRAQGAGYSLRLKTSGDVTSVRNYAIDDGLESIRFGGFHEVLMESGGERPTSIRLEAPTGERHKVRLLAPRPLLNLPRGLVAIEQRHTDIQQH